jgi:hypothetical protein
MQLQSLLASILLLGASTRAQDSYAVSFDGRIYYVDTTVPSATVIGSGLIGQNALGRANGEFWSTSRAGTSFFLTRLDFFAGTATVVWPAPDIRGLASAGGHELFAVHEPLPGQTSDTLSRIDTMTGNITHIGPTGFSSIQALTVLGGMMFAWDLTQGLLTIDPNTGVATDVDPSRVGPGMQTLSAAADGRLLGAGGASASGSTLYAIDIGTGTTVSIGTINGGFDIRGLEAHGGFSFPISNGCAGAAGQVTMSVTGMLTGNGQIVTTSRPHAPQVPGLLVLGLSSGSSGGSFLPILLDPILGTSGCTLFVSPDVTVFNMTSAGANAFLSIGMPLSMAARGVTVYAQHACFEPVPGGLSLSNAAQILIAP